MNKPVYLESKTLTYEFWYDYLKPKYNDDVKLCFVVNIKTFLLILTMMLKNGLIHLIMTEMKKGHLK